MNNLIANYDQILTFAQEYGLPQVKKRAVLREYLQTKILEIIYQEKISLGLFFVGGTSLRLLYGLDRFSEDLDFDTVGISATEIKLLMNIIVRKLQRENLGVDFYKNKTGGKNYYELRFPDLLFALKIGQNLEEKLTIKLDFESFWRGQERQNILLNRYGFLINIVTKTKNQYLVEKLAAYLNREQTQARDIYDIVWLIAQGAKIDRNFARKNHLPDNLVDLAVEKYAKERAGLRTFEAKLKPFLLEEKNSRKIVFFPEVCIQLVYDGKSLHRGNKGQNY